MDFVLSQGIAGMKPKKRRPLWPFVILLLLLLAASVVAPRLWQRNADSGAGVVRVPPALPAAPVAREVTPAWNPVEPPDIRPVEVQPEPKTTELFVPAATDIAMRPAPRPAPTLPPPVEAEPPLPTPITEPVPPPAAIAPAELTPEPVAEPTPPAIAWLEIPADDPIAQRLPAALLDELEALAAKPEGSDWARAVSQRLIGLSELPLEASAETRSLFQDLRQLAIDAPKWAAQAKTPELSLAFSRAGYALTRRLDLWERLYQGVLPVTANIAVTDAKSELGPSLAHLESGVRTTDGKALRDWLLLDNIRREAHRGDHEISTPERRAIAHRVLLRMKQTRVAAGPRQRVDQQALATLESELRRWVEGPLTAQQFLAQIERFELTRSPQDAQVVAELAQRLAISTSPEQQELGQYLDMHYRNANVRVVLNDRLMNRLMPQQQQPIQAAVSDYIGGVPVEGTSTTSTAMRIKLIPDANCLKLQVEANGNINSQTTSTSGPATFYNQGDATYSATKIIKIVPSGIRVTHAEANANSGSTLRGLSTDYDNVPLLSRFVRGVAQGQYDSRVDDTRWEVEGKISAQVKARIDQEMDSRLASAEKSFADKVLLPLEKMGLNPTCVSLSTTEQRAVARIRLAADEQLAAFTPRPQAPSDSWASLQLHQSVVNNAIAQLKLNGQTFTPATLQKHVVERTGLTGLWPQQEDPIDDVFITFADQEPLKVEIRDGELIISVSIAELASDKNKFKNFTGRAHYKPDLDGLRANLGRVGTLELLGDKLNTRSQVALRAVISKMFPKDRKLQLIPEKLQADPRLQGLVVTQCALEDGWIGLAFAPDRNAPRTAEPGKQPLRR